MFEKLKKLILGQKENSIPAHTGPAVRSLTESEIRDRFRGCLVGGAVGDALGYEVEFIGEEKIFARFGPGGIREYAYHNGLARISDDTQMTMFTACGLLRAAALEADPVACVADAYRDWYNTQSNSYRNFNRKGITTWLMHVPEIYAARAPGNTCLNAIYMGCHGSVAKPINNSKGCGGVMRTAPAGLFCRSSGRAEDAALLGAEAAALTHGHEMGYIPGAMLAHIVRQAACGETATLKDAVTESAEAMEKLFPEAKNLPDFLKLMDRAVELAESKESDLDAIHKLGAGWVGDEALAIAVYCALKYANDFEKAMIASVNHQGDSDSTGAICGNILGAWLGLSGIPGKFLLDLELKAELLELADDLYRGCPDGKDPDYARAWKEKYADVTYRA